MSKVTIITGSHRLDSQSLKIGSMIEKKLLNKENCQSVNLIDLAQSSLPFWQETYTQVQEAQIRETSDILKASDAYVFVTPEWNGMVPAHIKNLFLLYSANEFAHKPALIVSVSAGIGGSYPIVEMRSTTYKNSRICYIPEHIIFRHVGQIFNGLESDDRKSEDYLSRRTDYCLDYLLLYSSGLKEVRNFAPDSSQFTNGM